MGKRRKLRGVEYAEDGPHGRPAREIVQRWMRRGGRHRLNRMERQAGKRETRRFW